MAGGNNEVVFLIEALRCGHGHSGRRRNARRICNHIRLQPQWKLCGGQQQGARRSYHMGDAWPYAKTGKPRTVIDIAKAEDEAVLPTMPPQANEADELFVMLTAWRPKQGRVVPWRECFRPSAGRCGSVPRGSDLIIDLLLAWVK
jgi:hypothetical protein